MKTRLILGMIVSFALFTGLSAASRDAQWGKVEAARENGLPKTAMEALESIISGALADKAYDEAIKAIGYKIAFEGNIQGNKPEEQIARMQAELAKAPAAMKPPMEAILAHWYWRYFQQNRWRFMQRTQTAATAGTDLQTWDLARILTEIDRHFTAALSDKNKLQATPVGKYGELLQEGNVPDSYRPTMFDFLAYEALQFYQAGEHAATVGEDEFEISADGPIFSSVEVFANWQPTTTDSESPKLKAIRLYQALLKFHESDADRSAFYDADLARITYGKNVAVGENKDDHYKTALRNFLTTTAKHENSARAAAALATQLNQEGEPAKAHELAERALAAFPRSAGGAMCFNLTQQIEAKSAQLDTETVWNAPWPTLDVTYRNVDKIYFRAVLANFDDYVARSKYGLGNFDENQRKELLATIPTLEWSADLPPTRDYKQRTEQLASPTSLKPGFYFIIASHDQWFGAKENQVSVAAIWVSDLALVLRMQHDGDTPHSGFVVKGNSGEPVVGATVRFWERDRSGLKTTLPSTKTDGNGEFHFSSGNQGVVVLAEYGSQAVSSKSEIYSYRNNHTDDDVNSRTVFFTDRAIYRPGQTINFKAISFRRDQSAGKYSVKTGQKLTVIFSDPNGREIARSTHETNDYGSISGVFTAPRDGLLGNMTLKINAGSPGTTSINVEEYKRPKFQVELAAPTEAAKLEAPVTLTGKATAYTGAAIGGAKVKWRVERRVQLPLWCWWWQPPSTTAIARGTAATEPDGTFKIQFIAKPDHAVPEKNEPVFIYSIHADVTDTTGETRSQSRSVQAAYTALAASITAGEWQTPQTPVEFMVETKSLDADPQSAGGTVTIHALKQPAKVERASLQRGGYRWEKNSTEPRADPSNPDSWALGEVVAKRSFQTDAAGKAQVAAPLKAGIYRAMLETKDRFGKTVTARQTVQVVDPVERHYNVKLPNHFSAPKWSLEPGEKFTGLWATGYDTGRAFVEFECDGKLLKSYWTASDRAQDIFELPITEKMRGGVTVRVTSIRENRAYFNERIVDVPWSNKQLTVKWERFRSKLMPGEKETWTAIVTGPDAKRTTAEMVATLYDASLDQFLPFAWPETFTAFRRESDRSTTEFQNALLGFHHVEGGWQTASREVNWRYRSFPSILFENPTDGVVSLSAFQVSAAGGSGYRAMQTLAGARGGAKLKAEVSSVPMMDAASPEPELDQVVARKNLNETAFFFPQLLANDDGVVEMVFTMPEALTEWKFLGFAHDAQLRAGFLTAKVVTAKDLMVEPNPPRFVREGDAVEFTVKVSNQTDAPQTGTVRLTFADAATLQPMDDALANRTTGQAFDVPAKQSRTYSWRIVVPDGTGFLTYKAVGATAQASDGEEGFLPVLSRRILVTESLPLPIRGKTTKLFEFTKLLDSGTSKTLRQQSLTVQMVSQPAWYAVMALPYLMEYPYECSEQVFNRVYANTLARHIANSDPKIRRIFDLWKNTSALDSPLQKNQDIKSVMLEETPWLRDANNETQARKNIGLLFDANRLDEESSHGLRQLADRQLSDGLWPWFPGGPSSQYISLYITTGFGRLRHLGVDVDPQSAIKSLAALDAWIDEHYRRILESKKPDEYVPNYVDALYLYGRSFFLNDRPIAKGKQPAIDFFLRQSRKFWPKINSRQSQAQLALALQRFGDKDTPGAIVKSLKERSVQSEELGMFWRDSDLSWWWYHAPIETQAMMIEAFDEVAHDVQAVEDCKVWLLKQKQTQDWKTTKATADAIYALLLHGENLLGSDALVEVALAGETIKPAKAEAGTGFYEQKYFRDEIKPAMGHITVKKTDAGVSWGSVHWQYLEDMSKVTPHEGTPLKLKKTLFTKETTKKGQVLKPVTGPLSVGDELVVRIELRTDRDMEYIHLKDQRGSGTEPVNVLSRYKYQDGLAYYETTSDTASHFFIDYLPKGTYVFEYSTRVQLKGSYQTGIAEIQCMYAPEFNSHSESFLLDVK